MVKIVKITNKNSNLTFKRGNTSNRRYLPGPPYLNSSNATRKHKRYNNEIYRDWIYGSRVSYGPPITKCLCMPVKFWHDVCAALVYNF